MRPLASSWLGALMGILLATGLCAPALAADGDLDATFGDGSGREALGFDLGGTPQTDFDSAHALAIQGDGKVLVGGEANTDTGGFDWAVARLLPDGNLDPSFGSSGRATLAWNLGGENRDVIRAIEVQADGKILLVGEAESPQGAYAVIARLTSSGQLDSSYGVGGRVQYASPSRAFDAVLQPDGKLVVVGVEYTASGQPFLALRLTTSGSLDASFDGDGAATISPNPAYAGAATAVTLQADGKIVMIGWASAFHVVRLRTDGSLDSGFDQDGIADIDFGGGAMTSPEALAVQGDGRIVVAGSTPSGRFGLARLSSDGSLDSTFAGGQPTISFGGAGSSDSASDLALQDDGKIVVAGRHFEPGKLEFAVARLQASGQLDAGFASGGKTTFAIDGRRSELHAMAIQDDGRILLAGDMAYSGWDYDFALARLLASSTTTTTCTPSATTLCLQQNRFSVEIAWTDFQGTTRDARVGTFQTADSGLFYYNDPTNLEFLIKVIDGCSLTSSYWVFFAGTTNVGFTVEVRDTQTGQILTYTNPLGQPANAVTDTAGFATCP